MLLLQAIMRRRSMEWYTDPAVHGGLYVPNTPVLLERLKKARETKNCRRLCGSIRLGEICAYISSLCCCWCRNDTTIVAAVMVRLKRVALMCHSMGMYGIALLLAG